MPLSLQTAGLLLLGLIMTTPSHSADLKDYRWKQRVLLLSAPAADDPLYQEQVARLDAVLPRLHERDLVILSKFGPDPFTVVLIGKDGGEKLKSADPVTTDFLFALIDAMPMRRLEMQSRRQREESGAPSADKGLIPESS